MQVNIKEQKEQPIYNREVLRASISFQGRMPNRHEVAMALSKKISKSENLISVRKIIGNYGTQDAEVESFVYNDEESLRHHEPGFLTKRTQKSMPKKEAEKAE